MEKLFISVVWIALLGGCSGIQENVSFPVVFATEWKIGHSAQNRSQRVVEFVHKGEKIENWTELVTVQAIKKGSSDSELLDDFYNRISSDRSAHCPDSVLKVIARGERSLIYEWKIKCTGETDQHEIAKVLDGQHNRFRVAYAAKVSALSPGERAKWIKLLTDEVHIMKDNS